MMRVATTARPIAALVAGAVSCLLAGCGTGSPVQVSANAGSPGQPSAVPAGSASHPARSPESASASSSPARRSASATPSARARQFSGPPQRGIDIDFYDGDLGPGNTVATESPEYVDYVKGLGANWLSITFPLFESSRTSSVVVRRSATPSPADLSILIQDAQAAGLSVVLRPLLDSSNLGHSRVHWTPPNLLKWFASYQRVLMPYVQMAQRDHVSVLTVGVEFDYFAGSSLWNGLNAAVRMVYQGLLAFANNWDQLPAGNAYGGSQVREDVDAYPALQVPDDATITVLTRQWDTWAGQLRAGTVLGEVGIPAQPGMYRHPYWWKSNGPIARYVQVRWFAAACNAVVADHLGGLFFWSLPFGSSLTVPSGLADPGSWTATRGATEIARCFSRLKGVQ
ncbi:MAG: glycoside hydrolase family 113 [Streptosporangiaceae bacterium]